MPAPARAGLRRTPGKRKARQLARHLRAERPDYAYIKEVFRYLRTVLDVEVPAPAKETALRPHRSRDPPLLPGRLAGPPHRRRRPDQNLLYTGGPGQRLIRIRITDVDLDTCRIRITQGKGGKDRVVPFPDGFKETLALHIDGQQAKNATFLFESSWKKPYSDRGVRKILQRYATVAGLPKPISPHQLRRFVFTWLKTQGIDDALIQPYSGHASRQSWASSAPPRTLSPTGPASS